LAGTLAALDEAGLRQGTLIRDADHGCHEHVHRSRTREEMTIPWIVTGAGVVSGTTLETAIVTYDTAATALWALNLPLPEDLDGRPVEEAFR
jgi:arylsulfatase A-like enzyme